MKQGTFQQQATFILSGMCLVALMVMFCIKGNGLQATEIGTAIAGAFSICVMAMVKAASDAKNENQMKQLTDSHAAQMQQMTNGLINSTPISGTQIPQVNAISEQGKNV